MNRIFRAKSMICLTLLVFGYAARAKGDEAQQTASANSSVAVKVAYVIGIDGFKAKEKLQAQIDEEGLQLAGKQKKLLLKWDAIEGISFSSERMELWGIEGKILRSAIPDGGGMLVAGVLHHRVAILAFAYHAENGLIHRAVLQMPVQDAEALSARVGKRLKNPAPATMPHPVCSSYAADGVRVLEPVWNTVAVPESYRALLYENLIVQLEKKNSYGAVLRSDAAAQSGCPRWSVQLNASEFRQGNQVQRAVLGPLGMIASATKMNMSMTVRDEQNHEAVSKDVNAAIRADGASCDIAVKEAQKASKVFGKVVKMWSKDYPKHA